jgi:Yip1 domain
MEERVKRLEELDEIEDIESLSSSLRDRMIRAAKLDATFYDEIKADITANIPAFKAVLVAGMATGLGWGVMIFSKDGFALLIWTLLVGMLLAIATWLLGSFTIYLVGTRLFRTPDTAATYGGVLRGIGFAKSPATIGILLFVPVLGLLVFLATLIWTLFADITAVRQVMDFSTWRATATCIAGSTICALIIAMPIIVLSTIAKLA